MKVERMRGGAWVPIVVQRGRPAPGPWIREDSGGEWVPIGKEDVDK